MFKNEQERFDKDNLPIDLSALCVMKERSFENSWYSFSNYLKEKRRFTIEREDIQHFTDFLPELLSDIEARGAAAHGDPGRGMINSSRM